MKILELLQPMMRLKSFIRDSDVIGLTLLEEHTQEDKEGLAHDRMAFKKALQNVMRR